MQLTLEDGGPNDADSIANGSVEDPGGVTSVSVITTRNKSGGGAMGAPVLLVLLVLAVLRSGAGSNPRRSRNQTV